MGYKHINTLINQDPTLKERVRNVSVRSNKKKITEKEITARTYADVVKNTNPQSKIQNKQKWKIKEIGESH